jgi:hypothetical protein
MSLFQCSKCGGRENTALADGGYLARLIYPERLVELGLDPNGKYCSLCFTGKWHGKFPQEFYPLGSMMTDHQGNLKMRSPSPATEKEK